jgi:DNA-binding NtrC family response regulator
MSEIQQPDYAQPPENFRVLLVDDQPDFAHGLARLISGRFPRIHVQAVQSGTAALASLADQSAQLMITDLRMPEMNGMQLLKEALQRYSELSIVVLSAYGSIETAVEALRCGAYDFLTKPIEPDQLYRVVEKGLERSRLLEENSRLRHILSQQDAGNALIGEATVMQQLRRSIEAVAQADYTVLIRGESGTGKELAARLVHRLGTRSTKPFLAVNCPSIPESLLESELFGYVKGAFTGAHQDQKGLLSSVDTGTIHLDEIGDISPAVQTKLLRFLQDGEIRPVGAHAATTVNVRIIASTNQDLEARILDKTFRDDLYYRLNVLTLSLPPLRDRLEDIPLLAQYFLRKTCREMDIAEKEVDPEVLQWMSSLPWPGNVRELQNLVRRLIVFCTGERLDMSLVRMVMHNRASFSGIAPASRPTGLPLKPYKEAKAEVVDDFTRHYLHDLLPMAKGNISEAARLSGLSRVALQKILARLGEQAANFR